ncbi:hypothetical protein ACP275_01G110700 [Erythranthe tilingii]
MYMAVYYIFESSNDYESVALDSHSIQVGHLKERIIELKNLGNGTDFDLVVTNAHTGEEYLDEGILIPNNTSVLIRRVPRRPRRPIVTAPVIELEDQPSDALGSGIDFRRGMVGRGFGRGGFDKETPPRGYICHRCKVPGHVIRHCPTNGDPNFDIRRVRSPSGAVALLTPNEELSVPRRMTDNMLFTRFSAFRID